MPDSFFPKQMNDWNAGQPVQTKKSRMVNFIVEFASWTAAATIFFLAFKFISSLC